MSAAVTIPVRAVRSSEPALHWCVSVARRAGWTGAHALVVAPTVAIADAWSAVVAACMVGENEFMTAAAALHRIRVARWDSMEPQATRLVPEGLARKHRVFPLRETDRAIYIATADPTDVLAEQEIGFASGRRPEFELASPSAIRAALDAGYAPENAAATLLQAAGADLENAVQLARQAEPEAVRAQDAAAEPVVGLANLILRDGVNARASDIHVEPGRVNGVVRFRVDGVMREYVQLPMPVFNRVVSRIKVMGGLDIADRLRPQDGRARIRLPDGKTVDLRLSTVPTRGSEKCVIRILDAASTRTLDEVGLPSRELVRVKQLISQRNGIVLVTGPTGSGKTTTLYGAITDLADGEVNITTIEDPVEYEVGGITQIQIEPKRDVTFASTLRAVLRQDPDIVFVGEIRDAETAETSAHAATTGHLVLSTLHTNDAVGVIARLTDLGLDRAVIATTLRGAVAQRLVRRLCDHCAQPAADALSADEARLAALTGVRPARRAVGCDRCSGAGYFGRMAIAEVFVVSASIETLIANGAPIPAIALRARAEGMRVLSEVALDAVGAGATTLEEVERVIGFQEPESMTATPRVLLVDDDPVIRSVSATVLRTQGFDAVEAPTGEAALVEAQAAGGHRLIVLDLDLPDINGREILRRLRAEPATRHTPVIILTGSSDAQLEIALMNEGADDYLRKPIEPARLIARVAAVLRRTAQR